MAFGLRPAGPGAGLEHVGMVLAQKRHGQSFGKVNFARQSFFGVLKYCFVYNHPHFCCNDIVNYMNVLYINTPKRCRAPLLHLISNLDLWPGLLKKKNRPLHRLPAGTSFGHPPKKARDLQRGETTSRFQLELLERSHGRILASRCLEWPFWQHLVLRFSILSACLAQVFPRGGKTSGKGEKVLQRHRILLRPYTLWLSGMSIWCKMNNWAEVWFHPFWDWRFFLLLDAFFNISLKPPGEMWTPHQQRGPGRHFLAAGGVILGEALRGEQWA